MRKYKISLCLFMLAFIIGAGAGVVYAGTASSTWKQYGPVLGYYYENAAIVYTCSDGAQATSVAVTPSGQAVPTGYVGAQARLYNTSGTLCRSSSWMYNSSPCAGVQPSTSPLYTIRGAYYSKGSSAAYNGSGYYTYSTNQSPNQTY